MKCGMPQTVNNSVECHPIRQQNKERERERERAERSCWSETKTEATRGEAARSFPHWGHLSERNVTTASPPPQWANGRVSLALTRSTYCAADRAANAALALRAPRKRVTERWSSSTCKCICVCMRVCVHTSICMFM